MADRDFAFEVERYELLEPGRYTFELGRRDFVKLLGGGIVVCLAVKPALAQESGARGREEEKLPDDIAAWLHIAQDGAVTVFTGKAELGQNIRTSLSQAVAEELKVPISAITLTMGDTALTPFDMGTFGSRTTPTMNPQLRNVAAAARELLIDLAAKRWSADKTKLVAEDGKIVNRESGKSFTYGELTQGQKLVQVISDFDPPLEPATEWKIAGTPVPKIGARAFVTGEHQYTYDMTKPDMLWGKVLRPPAFNATLKSLDVAETRNLPGVQVVRDGNFVGVAAPDERTASRVLRMLKAEWDVPQQPSEKELSAYLRQNAKASEGGRNGREVKGDPAAAAQSADKRLAQTYTISYIAHCPLEPRAAVAEWSGDKVTVWTGSQRPFGIREELSRAFHIPLENARVIIPDTGSAYGGKHTGDAALEAARLAKAAGKAVKLNWTREEELTWAYFRPAGVIDVKSAAKSDGTLVAWEFDNYNSGPSAIATPYDVPNQRIEFHPSDSPLRQGSYRGLAATANHFARESHMDEMAHELTLDPLEFRLKNLTDKRLRAVLTAAAEKFGWGKQKPTPERGFGLACGFEKGGWFACCSEVAITNPKGSSAPQVRITRVVEAFDCGAVVNPNGLRNQIEGAIVQGIGGALFEAIHFENGKILNPHFAEYRMPRFSDIPKIEVILVDRKDQKSAGAGETPIMGIAPATGNAIFAATGVRLRSMPMAPEGLKTKA